MVDSSAELCYLDSGVCVCVCYRCDLLFTFLINSFL